MRHTTLACVVLLTLVATGARAQSDAVPDNAAIDMQQFLRISGEAAAARASRRITEADFIRMSREPGTLVLDARSRQGFDQLHIKGAINLSFPDIAVKSLHDLIPDKNTRILIYCNNNFRGAEEPFPAKLPAAALNLSTYVALYSYGYRNLYELAPQIDVKQSKLAFESSRPSRERTRAMIP
jgi:phage shock protein E